MLGPFPPLTLRPMSGMYLMVVSDKPITTRLSKSIDIRYHFIRDWVKKQVFTLFYRETSKNEADLLTKALPKPLHDVHTGFILGSTRG